jgi:hypothetical protein
LASIDCIGELLVEQTKHKRIGESEVTGHTHLVEAEDAYVVGDQDERELTAPSGTGIKHEEHKRIEVPADQYRVFGQQEIDPDTEEARTVRD